MLSGLFGGATLDTMAQSIGKFAGLDGATSKSLLGMLGPVVLGTLVQQQRSAGLDTSGLAALLGSQKDQIAAAIPSGLADHRALPASSTKRREQCAVVPRTKLDTLARA